MKRTNQFLPWALFLLAAGIFLLLKNLGVFRQWGEVVWGGLFAVVGLAFIIWFIVDRERYWRAIAGFTLLGIGAMILLRDGAKVNLGTWSGALVLFGVALGFWAVLLAHADNWWAVIPAGVLTVVGLLVGFGADLGEPVWLGALLVGLGLVFLLLYLVRFGQHDTRWAGVPAASLLLVGLVTWAGTLAGSPDAVKKFWPAALIVAGLVLLVLFLLTRRPAGALPAPVQEPAPGAPISEAPPAGEPSAAAPGDIYDVLAQQPPGPTTDDGR